MREIIIDNKRYFVTKGTSKYPQPHIEDSNGNVPTGKQRALLFAFLRQNNIEPPKDSTTHWCVNKVLSMVNGINAKTITLSDKNKK